MRAVKGIWPVRMTFALQPQSLEPRMSDAVQQSLTGRQAINDSFAPHVMTQVDKLHAEGITGAGVKVAVLDTGS